MNLSKRRNAVTAWDPFDAWNSILEDNLAPIARRMNEAFDQAIVSPAVEIHQTDDAVALRAELPGLKKEDIELTVHKDTVTLQGNKKDEVERKDGDYRYSERRFGQFSRTFSLPRSVDPSRVEAKFENGVLEVKIPVAEEEKPRKIEIGG